MPASSAVREQLKPNMDKAGQAMLDYLGNLGDLAGSIPPASPPGQGEITDALVRASEEVSFGAKTPEQGAKDFVEAANAILSRNS